MLNQLHPLWAWITDNAIVVGGLASIGHVLIWGIAMQVAVSDARALRRPSILIKQGKARRLDSPCLISNMGHGVVFVESIIARLETDQRTLTCDITELTDEDTRQQPPSSDEKTTEKGEIDKGGGEEEGELVTRMGPLNSMQYMKASNFDRIIAYTAEQHGLTLDSNGNIKGSDETPKAIDINLIVIQATEKRPIGARRRFRLVRCDNGRMLVVPESNHTYQLYSRRQRRSLDQWRQEINIKSL
ncbi:hypothetical protein [Kushneria marisflavi]|uniref:Uncharacterized protein n=1 Tax=Kushneria marisflavi TaxID=157779 RepID=A0A240UNR1_9GAMM|nr:hypothetical protein [Kushneria marisflavi]ART62766.1 hypothetical protein B9H00_06625 [Kushneria marisflavi]RKD83824.1 hypothetical protein C8D96_2678 [Kushneria marisflavi]